MYDKLTHKMQSFLKAAFPHLSCTRVSLKGDGGLRTYTRILPRGGGHLPAVLVRSSCLREKQLFLSRRREFEDRGLCVPSLRFSDLKSRFFLLEDLGNHTLQDVVQKQKTPGREFFLYQKALEQMLCLQDRAWGLKWPQHGYSKLLKEFLWTKTFLLDRFLKFRMEPVFFKNLKREWRHLLKTLSQGVYLPGHRDFHSRNLMIKNQKVYMIDFQDCALLPRFYDLSSLLYDPYVSLSGRMRLKLLRYHHRHPGAFFFPNPGEMEITAVQRLFKACGNFAEFYILKNKATHLKYIAPSLQDMEGLLKSLKTYPVFLKLIQQIKKRMPLCL